MNPQENRTSQDVTRRVALGLGVAGIAAAAGCADSEPKATPQTQATTNATESVIGKTSDISVGGAKIFPESKIVVSQPVAGEFKGFSSICPHKGCGVSKIEGTEIHCVCHNSIFSSADGAKISGPSESGLPTRPIKISGDEITLG